MVPQGIEGLRNSGEDAAPLSRSRMLRARLALSGILIAVYLALEWFSFLQEFRGLPVTPWNPGLGVLFAFLILRGPSYGVLLFVAVLLSEFVLLRTQTAWLVVPIAAIIAIAYTAAATGIRAFVGMNIEFDRIRDVVTLLAGGAAGAALVAVILPGLFISDIPGQQRIMLQIFVGDMVGIAVMTPLTLRLTQIDFSRLSESVAFRRAAEIPLHVLGLAIGLALVGQWVTPGGFESFYILFVPIVITAVRFGFDGACIALAAVQFALGTILHTVGADVRAFTDFQTSLLALTTIGLFVGAEVNARMRSERLVKQAEARLQEMKAEAAQAGRLALVDSMASALAHEINQPMTAARALMRSSQVLIGTEAPDLPRASANIGTAIAQIDHAANVLRRMRDFLKRRSPSLSTHDVRELLDEALLLSRNEAAASGITITADLRGQDLIIAADRVQMQQVLLNLLHNAVEAMAGASLRGTIKVSAERKSDPARIEFAVIDSGPGVPEDLREHLFEPMRTSKGEGLGLGLAICVTIVEAHGGRIWLHSGAPGATEFRFWIPLDQPED